MAKTLKMAYLAISVIVFFLTMCTLDSEGYICYFLFLVTLINLVIAYNVSKVDLEAFAEKI